MKVIHIEWLDSQTDIGWDGLESIELELGLSHTIGFLVAETKDSMVLAHSFDPATNEWNGRIYIPICSIIEMRTLCHVKI